MHLCNAPKVTCKQWPTNEVLAFGNSPPPKTLQKVNAGRKYFQEIVAHEHQKDELVTELMQLLLRDQRHWPDDELTLRAPNWAERLSSIHVKMPEEGYGSR